MRAMDEIHCHFLNSLQLHHLGYQKENATGVSDYTPNEALPKDDFSNCHFSGGELLVWGSVFAGHSICICDICLFSSCLTIFLILSMLHHHHVFRDFFLWLLFPIILESSPITAVDDGWFHRISSNHQASVPFLIPWDWILAGKSAWKSITTVVAPTKNADLDHFETYKMRGAQKPVVSRGP